MAYPQMPGYPAYQNPYPQPYQDRIAQLQAQYQQTIPQIPNTQPMQQINQGFSWVQGEAGAKSYLVAPNTTVLLMDADSPRFYMKSTDASGIPNLRTFEFSEVTQTHLQTASRTVDNLDNKYVTRAEYDGLIKRYEAIIDKINSLQTDHVVGKPSGRTEQKSERSKGGDTDEQSAV